jgi:hypothetical protein
VRADPHCPEERWSSVRLWAGGWRRKADVCSIAVNNNDIGRTQGAGSLPVWCVARIDAPNNRQPRLIQEEGGLGGGPRQLKSFAVLAPHPFE